MKVWVDAQLSPAIAQWLIASCGVEAVTVKAAGFRDAEDSDIFFAARTAGAVVMTKDSDFVTLVRKHGPPPQVLWITCGNTSNTKLVSVLGSSWSEVLSLVGKGEPLIEISGRST